MRRSLLTCLCIGAIAVLGFGVVLAQDPVIQVIHNSPDAGAVDIYLNAGATPAIQGLDFRQATGLINVFDGAGMYTIGIAAAPSSGPGDIFASFGPFDLTDGSLTLFMAAGELGTDFALIDSELWWSSSGGTCAVKVFHGSPDAGALDIFTVDGFMEFYDLAYLSFQGYYQAENIDWILGLRPAGEEGVTAGFDLPLSGFDGEAIVVFASGNLGGAPDFGLYVAENDGTVTALPPNDTVDAESATWGDVKALYR